MEDMDTIIGMMECEVEARQRYAASEPYQAWLSGQYKVLHHYFAPPVNGWGSGDQWPGDRVERPGKIHVTANITRPIVSSSARLEAMLPRVTIPSSTLPEPVRRRAEGTEQLMMTWLDMSGWDVWLYDLCLSKGIYGKGVLKTFWNKAEKRGDVIVVERPENLRIGWGANDYSVKDWALYEYKLSEEEIERRFPNIEMEHTGDKAKPIDIRRRSDHADPLDQKDMSGSTIDSRRSTYRTESEYERLMIPVWDYWYRSDGDDEDDGEAGIWNVVMVGGVCAEPPKLHKELRDIPYIVIEHDHEPGSPEGTGGVIDLIDLQIEMNRLLSHAYQYVADNVDPAWYIKGEDAAGLPEGIIPKSGEATNLGNSDILEVPKGGANTFPITEIIDTTWNFAHRISGMPEIGLGGMASSDVSGRAVAVQIQSHANRMEPRRNRLYRGLKSLIQSWIYMAEQVNPRISVGTDPETGEEVKKGVKELVAGMYNWKIIAPEITPRDAAETVTVEINKLNAKGTSLRTFMDNTGVENPEAEIDQIKQERMDAQLFPADAQAYLGIMTMLQQLQMTQQQMMSQMGMPQGQGMSAQAQTQSAVNQMQQDQYAAQPTGFEDQNQPQTQAGMPPPGNGQGPAQNTTLIRGGVPLNQIAFTG